MSCNKDLWYIFIEGNWESPFSSGNFAIKLCRQLQFLVLIFLGAASCGAVEPGPGRVLFLGDSLTVGYGIDRTHAYPSLIQEEIRRRGLAHQVHNGSLSGDTTVGGMHRVEWLMQKPISVLVLALGANDALRGLDPVDTQRNLQAIIDAVRRMYPECKILIAGMKAPPNMGVEYTRAFEKAFVNLAARNDAPLISFLLKDVAANPELNLEDGIHPNEKGHRVIAATVWKYLYPLLDEKTGEW